MINGEQRVVQYQVKHLRDKAFLVKTVLYRYTRKEGIVDLTEPILYYFLEMLRCRNPSTISKLLDWKEWCLTKCFLWYNH